MDKKCLVLFSNGLDSRLVVKLIQDKGFDVIAVYFRLPFAKDSLEEVKKFCKREKVEIKLFDCCRGKLLKDYLGILDKAQFGRGAGFNPCIDCKIFMLKKAKEFAKKKNIDKIFTGEVEGQRPMSQTSKSMKTIEGKIGFKIIRVLDELGIKGRTRKKQMQLAEKYNIDYPSPAGGCLLCERRLKNRFKVLIKNNLINENTLKITNIGRHFYVEIPKGISNSRIIKHKNKINKKEGCWFVVARNKEECLVINSFNNSIKDSKGNPSVYFSKKKVRKFAEELQKIYRTGASDKERRKFQEEIL